MKRPKALAFLDQHEGNGSEAADYNPVAIVFCPLRKTKVSKFRESFREYKHGRPEPLEKATEEFFRWLGSN